MCSTDHVKDDDMAGFLATMIPRYVVWPILPVSTHYNTGTGLIQWDMGRIIRYSSLGKKKSALCGKKKTLLGFHGKILGSIAMGERGREREKRCTW